MKSIALLFAASLAVSASESGAFDRSLVVSGSVQLDLRSDPGGIIVTSGSGSSVHVRGIIKPLLGMFDMGTAEANIRALERNPPIQQEGNRIRIGYPADEAVLRGVSMRLEIETPVDTKVDAHTTSGGIQIDGVAGPVASATSSGGTQIRRVGGDVHVTSHSGAVLIMGSGGSVYARNMSGGIEIADAQGSIDAETTSGRTEISGAAEDVRSSTHSGSIRIDNVKGSVTARNHSGSIDAFQLAGAVEAQTKSGAIRISQTRPAPIRALADSGAISVELARPGDYTINAQSKSGKISGRSLSGTLEMSENHRLQQQVGAGGPLVDLDTRSSKIEIN